MKPRIKHQRRSYRHKGKDGWRDEYTVYGPFAASGPHGNAQEAHTALNAMNAALTAQYPNAEFVDNP